jgi:hypothetical protein
MDKLIFHVLQRRHIDKTIEWGELDAVLQSPQFSELRTVQLNVVSARQLPGPVVDKFLASFPIWLSQCHARGILSIRLIGDDSEDGFIAFPDFPSRGYY